MNHDLINNLTKSQPSNAEVLDNAAVNRLIKDTSLATLPAMFLVFVDELDKRVVNLNEAINTMNVEEVREQSHALKSCAGTFGAMRLFEDARKLEDEAKLQQMKFDELTLMVKEVLKVVELTRKNYLDYGEKIQHKIDAANH